MTLQSLRQITRTYNAGVSGVQAFWRRVVEVTRETQWVLPVVGAVIGVVLALSFGLTQASPDKVNWTLTVSDGRGTLLSWLSILFAAFSIILALATLTIQNVVSKFSVRMYRLYQRDMRDRLVLALFAMTAAYIGTEQVLLRSADPAEPVPATGFLVALVLLVGTGIALIWYITTIPRWFRVDQVAHRISKRLLTLAEIDASTRVGKTPAMPAAFERPPGAIPIRAHRSGYIVEPDPRDLVRAIPDSGTTAVVALYDGTPVVSGEEIGWLVAAGDGSERRDLDGLTDRISRMVEVERERGLTGSLEYGIVVLVDIAIMALSPAINDPNTAVQVLDEMTLLFAGLSHHELGSFAMHSDEHATTAVVRSMGFADYLKLATEQIVLYGKDDPRVVRSLGRMVDSLSALDLSGQNGAAVDDLRASVESIVAG